MTTPKLPRMSQSTEEKRRPHQNDKTQWMSRSEWIAELRAHKNKFLQEEGLQGFDLWEAMVTLSFDHKIAALAGSRCSKCWHITQYCICQQVEKLRHDMADHLNSIDNNKSNFRIQLCILMHKKEYLCAGNSAKLLFQLLPHHTELYLYGKQGELDRLREDTRQSSIILWPSTTAVSLQQFLERGQSDRLAYTTTIQDERTSHLAITSDTSARVSTIRAIVLDGTYNQARSMFKSLRKQWGEEHLPCVVKLAPTTSSVFHRAQKNYGKAHHQLEQQLVTDKDSFVKRVSTAEACGYLWVELYGTTIATKTIQESIVEAVIANNKALAQARSNGSNTA